jgi:hypothetical protein
MMETLDSDAREIYNFQSWCITYWSISFQLFFFNKIIVDHSNRTNMWPKELDTGSTTTKIIMLSRTCELIHMNGSKNV